MKDDVLKTLELKENGASNQRSLDCFAEKASQEFERRC